MSFARSRIHMNMDDGRATGICSAIGHTPNAPRLLPAADWLQADFGRPMVIKSPPGTGGRPARKDNRPVATDGAHLQ